MFGGPIENVTVTIMMIYDDGADDDDDDDDDDITRKIRNPNHR